MLYIIHMNYIIYNNDDDVIIRL